MPFSVSTLMGGIKNTMGPIVAKCETQLCHLKFCGRINRPIRYKTGDQDDRQFYDFYLTEYKLSMYDKFTDYKKTKCNFDALMPSLLKYDRVGYNKDLLVWREASYWTEKHFIAMSGSKIIKLSETFPLMEPATSPGYPFSLLEKTKNKLFEHLDVMESIADFDKMIQVEETPVLWAVNEKDEMRAIEKIRANRIRTFVGCPIDLLATSMRLFFDMNERMYQSANVSNWSFVGASKFEGGWDRLARRLEKHPNTFELDEEDYDCSLDEEMLMTCARIRYNMLEPKERTPETWIWIKNVYREIIHSYMVCPMGDILQKALGNPSGSFNTITDNVLVLFTLLAYAWLILAPDHMKTYADFMTHVEAVLCGDDNTWSVSDVAVHFFNAVSVAKVWNCIGIKTKTDHWVPRKLSECWFMSSGFKYISHPFYNGAVIVVPVPETQKILCSLCYHNKGETPKWSLLRAAALRIESFWDEECRLVVWQFILFLLKKYHTELHAIPTMSKYDILTYEQAFSVIKTDDQIVDLFLGQS